MENIKTVYCFGDCNVDMMIPVDALPVCGGCCFSNRCMTGAGGSMLNTATALHRLGISVMPITKIGNDFFGKTILDYFAKQNICTDGILKSDDMPTGMVMGLVESGRGEKYWVSVRLNAADIHIKHDEITGYPIPDILFITGVELTEGKESRETAIAYANKTHSAGGRVYLDPNIRVPQWVMPDDVKDAFRRIMYSVDVLLANEKELCMIGENSSVKEAAHNVIQQGAASVWVKLGENGCRYISETENLYFNPIPIKAVDTSGAGDAFNGAIIYAEMHHLSKEQTGRFANMFAGYTVQHLGTAAALPSNETILTMVRHITV